MLQVGETPPAAQAAEASARWIRAVLFATILYAAIRNCVQAIAKPLWFDELLTELLAREPGVSALWRSLKTGVDANPPPFYLIERVVGGLAANEHISYRLASILAFAFTLTCLYIFVERRSGPAVGAVCACLIFLTPLYGTYADEARPYSMFVACIAFALVCYQRVPSVLPTIGVFASLLLAMCLHYYALLAVAPFVAAELLFAYRARRIRIKVWAALLGSLVPLAIWRPLVLAVRLHYGEDLWSRPQLMDALRIYGQFFRVDTPWGLAFAGISFAAVALACLWVPNGTNEDVCPVSEHLLVLCFLVYPFGVFIFARLGHGGAVPRYSLCAILGVAIGFRYVLAWLQPRATFLAAVALLLAMGTQEFSFWHAFRLNPGGTGRAAADLLQVVDSVRRDDLPLVVADAGEYFEILHYASPGLRHRMVSLVDPPKAVRYLGTDSLDKNMIALREVADVKVYDFSTFIAMHQTFLLYSNGSAYDWLPRGLADEGDSLSVLRTRGNDSLYLVHLRATLDPPVSPSEHR